MIDNNEKITTCVMHILDCQKCFHTDCLSAYKTLPSRSSLASPLGAHSQRSLSRDSPEDEIRTPDVKAIENCSFYSSASSPTSQINIVSFQIPFDVVKYRVSKLMPCLCKTVFLINFTASKGVDSKTSYGVACSS